MREYKFMAWDKRNKRMDEIDGMDLYIADGRIYEVYPSYIGYETTFEKKDVTENYELMQYTGLKDKNGKEIYEGDILRERPDATFRVTWDTKWAKFKLDCIEHYEYPEWNRGVKMEIIGNVYENPELLGV